METKKMNCQAKQNEPPVLPAEKAVETSKIAEDSVSKECKNGVCTINWKPHRR